MRRTPRISLLVATALAFGGLTAAAPASALSGGATHVHADGSVHDHGRPVEDPARGLWYDGLERSTDTRRCDAGYAFASPALADYCTHGPDAAPEGVDVRTAQTAPVTEEQAAAAGDLVCDGDGVSGFRAEAVYVHLAGNQNRYEQYAASFRAWAATIQQEVAASTVEHDPTADPLYYRFVHTPTAADGSCDLVVHVLELPQTADDSFDNTISELKARGFDDPQRNYLVWMDANRLCGIGTLYGDANPDPAANYNNFGYRASYSRADTGCWNYAETHELLHNIGAVQNNAPNASGGYHCNDDRDIMCYGDGGSTSAMFVDPNCSDGRFENLLDCNGDDYFNPSPAPGSYLADNWNTADSWWLFTSTSAGDGGGGGDPVDPGTTEEVFTGSLNRKRTSETFGFSTGTGDVTVVLDDGTTVNAAAKPEGKGGGSGKGGGGGGGDSATAWTVELLDGTSVVGTATGAGVVTLDAPGTAAGDYTVRVSGGKGGFTVTVTHP